jgi:poly(A) polymerase Pap1
VTELHPVPDAHVPVMRFRFNGISIDLVYAMLALWDISEVSDLCALDRSVSLNVVTGSMFNSF